MDKTEEKLIKLVRLHYSEDWRSFDQLVRNLVGGRGSGISPETLMKLRDAVPDEVRVGNPLR